MLGLGLQINKMVNRAGGLPPLASLLTFFSKQRDDTTVINKLDGSGDTDGSIVGEKYLDFSDVNTYFEIDKSELDYSGQSYMKIEAVFNKKSGQIVSIGTIDSVTNRLELNWYSDNQIYFIAAAGSNAYGKTDIISSFDTDLKIVAIYNGGGVTNTDRIKIYINGIEQSLTFNGSTPTVMPTFTNNFQIGNDGTSVSSFSNGKIKSIKLYSDDETVVVDYKLSSGGDKLYNTISPNKHAFAINYDADVWGYDLSKIPFSVKYGYSVIDGVVGEIPPLLGTQVDALNGEPLTNPAISKISNLGDGYYKLPIGIKIGGLDLFKRDETTIYNSTCTNAEEYVSEDPYLWHVDELNTERILSYLNDAYKFTWFVKNTFTEGTYEPLTIKEIFAYSQKIADSDDLSKIMKYLKINVWYDSQIWDDDEIWID